MKKLSKRAVRTNKGLMIVVVSVLGTITLAACSVNYKELAEGINDLGAGVDHAINGTSEAAPSESVPAPSSGESDPTAESIPDASPVPTPAPTVTPTPVPTPTPMPERVDMSKLTTDEITSDVEILSEDFAESYHVDGDETVLTTFTGNRVAVKIPDSKNVQTALNLIYEGFYQEAEGLYKRYSSEGESQYTLDPENYLVAPYSVEIKNAYSYNGRLMSVVMEYTVKSGEDVIEHKTEISTCDILTGQYITPALVAKDPYALSDAIAAALADGITTDEFKASKKDVTDANIITHPESAGTVFAEACGYIKGELYRTPIDLSRFADYLNSFGKVVYKIN
jgi:hypothetical protein